MLFNGESFKSLALFLTPKEDLNCSTLGHTQTHCECVCVCACARMLCVCISVKSVTYQRGRILPFSSSVPLLSCPAPSVGPTSVHTHHTSATAARHAEERNQHLYHICTCMYLTKKSLAKESTAKKAATYTCMPFVPLPTNQ